MEKTANHRNGVWRDVGQIGDTMTNVDSPQKTTRADAPGDRHHSVRGGGGVSHALEIDHITKCYGHSTVVDNLSFTVHPGRVTVSLGPNGAGKSTTRKILLDLASADGGRATIGGFRY